MLKNIIIQYRKFVGGVVPLFWVDIDKNKYNESVQGSCDIRVNPILLKKLSYEEYEELQTCINRAIDILRDRIEDIDMEC